MIMERREYFLIWQDIQDENLYVYNILNSIFYKKENWKHFKSLLFRKWLWIYQIDGVLLVNEIIIKISDNMKNKYNII